MLSRAILFLVGLSVCVHAGDAKIGSPSTQGMAWIPGGEFTMGSNREPAQPNESPAHKVRVHGFWMDRTPVTNAQFKAFVEATGYVTTAEKKPDWASLKAQLPPGTPKPSDSELVPGAMVFVGSTRPVNLDDYSQWWKYVPGASWKHPEGPDSSIQKRMDHPVVEISYADALAYAHWLGKRLPTEAEWEYAARGGLEGATYSWGNDLTPSGHKMANIWEGSAQPFPRVSGKGGSVPGTTKVRSFPPNGYGLYDMTGNVWEWVADWYRADAYARIPHGEIQMDPAGPSESYDPEDAGIPANAPKRVIRGGSFLCNKCYCLSYRPSARRGNDPDTGMSHLGFRLVLSGSSVPGPKQK